jgi:hypothetical protein
VVLALVEFGGVDHPLGDQEVRELRQAPGRERQAVLGRPRFRDLLDLEPYFGYSEANPSALKLWITSRTGPPT